MSSSARLLLAVPICLALTVGCTKGNRSANATVTGKVTYNGAPVTGGNLNFFAEGAGMTPVLIKPDGTFTGTDLPVDKEVTVTVETETLNPNKKMPDYNRNAGGGAPGAAGAGGAGGGTVTPGPMGGLSPMPEGRSQGQAGKYVKVPGKYGEKTTSPLKKTLKSGKNTWDMELTD